VTSEIHRVLKQGGRLLALEAGLGELYSDDEFVTKIYDRVMPVKRNGLVGV